METEYSGFIILNIWIVHESEILNIFKKQSALDEVVHFVQRKSDFFFFYWQYWEFWSEAAFCQPPILILIAHSQEADFLVPDSGRLLESFSWSLDELEPLA